MAKAIWFALGVVTGGVGRPLATHATYWALILVVAFGKYGYSCVAH